MILKAKHFNLRPNWNNRARHASEDPRWRVGLKQRWTLPGKSSKMSLAQRSRARRTDFQSVLGNGRIGNPSYKALLARARRRTIDAESCQALRAGGL
jgi:hypothetical protein